MDKKSHFFSKRDDFVHADVEGLGRYFLNKLEVEANADALHGQMMA